MASKAIRTFTVRTNRLKQASLFGLTMNDKGELLLDPNEDMHYVFLPCFDSGEVDGLWGRFHFSAKLPEEVILKIYAYSTNEHLFVRKGEITEIDRFMRDDSISPGIKMNFFKVAGSEPTYNTSERLLYEEEGRYLWIAVVVDGVGEGSLGNFVVNNPGDIFMNTLPAIYRERNGFFHRWLSIFSSIFNDFQANVDGYSDVLNVDTANKELLEVFAGWLGIDVSGDFLDEETLRNLVRHGYDLNRMKGTKLALEKLTEIVLGERAMIVEKKVAPDGNAYGRSVYDVTLFVQKYVDEKKRSQLFFLMQQFVPVRSKLNIIFLNKKSLLDNYSYLDINASVYNTAGAELDQSLVLDGNTILSE